MKVLLVATNRERSPYPVAPLGALCVAAAARDAGYEVDFLDLGISSAPDKSLEKALSKGDYEAVAFGIRNLDNCWSFAPRLYFDEVRRLAETVKRCFSGPLILGGTGFSVAPHGWMQRLDATCGVIGEGERVFPEVLWRLETGQPLEGLSGVITSARNGTPVEALSAPVIEKLSDLPLPAHDLCGYTRYLNRGGFVGVQTKRGCPLGCSYCIYPMLEGKRYRLRAPEAIVEEVERVVVEQKQKHFFFVDSVFNDPRKHALAVCKQLRKQRLPIQWSAFCNPLGFDDEVARAMKAAGCTGVEFGLDVATPKMLESLGKPFTQAEIKIALDAARDADLPFVSYMLFGGPGETWKDVQDTQSFLNTCAPANAVFASFGIRVFEGTPLAGTAKQEGMIPQGHDLFQPFYYLSPDMAEKTVEKLDVICRQRAEWTSPADWRRPMMLWAQKIMVLFRVRPQWKYIKGYGEHMRKHLK
jgi:radical SAM superfamily enzyme YgiQ (UPF0313 family)